ncbi:MAG: UMP kinase, partial [Rhodospirillaceae bacterium]|nr:UMP kinase [Rhodospirillaceae bacterium]
MKDEPKYRRVLLKLSGEALMGGRSFGLDPETLERIATEVKSIHDIGIEVCLV